jgi:hypothetical protein
MKNYNQTEKATSSVLSFLSGIYSQTCGNQRFSCWWLRFENAGEIPIEIKLLSIFDLVCKIRLTGLLLFTFILRPAAV